MNPPKCNEIDSINFWIATQKNYSCLEAGKVHPQDDNSPAHDSLTRLLQRNEPDTSQLFNESKSQVSLKAGILVIDDSTLDKPYAKQVERVTKHGSGKHRSVVNGIS